MVIFRIDIVEKELKSGRILPVKGNPVQAFENIDCFSYWCDSKKKEKYLDIDGEKWRSNEKEK